MQGTAGLNLNTAGLTAGGDTAQLINATSGLTPQAWTSIWPLTPGEHGVGFLLITPKDWRNDLVQSELPAGVNAATLSPWRPQDAFLVVACHLKWQVDQFLKAGQAALTAVTSALVSFGNTVLQIWETAWPIIQNLIADITNPIKLAADILSLTSSLLTQFIDNGNIYFDYLTGFLTGNLVGAGGNGISIPGGMCAVSTANPSGNCPYPYLKPIGIPAFYYDPPKFASYDAYAFGIVNIVDKNQCTYGAVAEWLTLHQSDSHWYGPTVSSQHPFTGAIDAGHFYGTAVAAGYTVSSAPVSGALVVYKNYAFGPSFPAGHLATVVGVSADGRHFMVMDQNWLNPEENYAEIGPGFPPYRWNLAGFDLRTDYWPNAGIAGFIWGPPGTKVG
jgi:hypothetical protein